jgi:hypothetical protein
LLGIGIIGAENWVQAGDFSVIEKALGGAGQMQEGAYVVRFSRSDLKVTISSERVPTALGFGSWTAWKETGMGMMVMGDIVLLEKEVNPFISALAEANINITALHNHFFFDEPRIMFMHIGGMGDPAVLGRAIRTAISKTGTPLAPRCIDRHRHCPGCKAPEQTRSPGIGGAGF